MPYLQQYLIATVIFFGIDLVWLTTIAKSFYARHLGYLMSPTPNLAAAGLFYLINILGIVLLVVAPSVKSNSITQLLWSAALYGLCTYATYDLTNLATIKDWPLIVTIVDLIWGIALTTAVSLLTFLVYTKVLGH